ncbi:MAG: folate-binding protein [Actinobacteria bacterium]|nr:folate-binding protein [Actinomycetota bacterium]
MTAVLVEAGPDAGAIWHFGEPNQEQRALAAGSAWADLSHRAVLSVTGADRLSWLHSLTTQDVEKLTPGLWVCSLILDPTGHIAHQFYLVDDGTTTWIHTEKEKLPELLAFLEKMKFMLRVEVQDRTNQYAVLRAPGVADGLGGPYALVTYDELDEMKSAFNKSHTQVGTWALEAERVAAGRARILFETDHKSIPNELGFLNNAVHMKKGCYPGQETVAKVFNLGQPPRRLTLLHLDGSAIVMPNTGDKVMLDEKEVGFIGTVARHYELGPIALAVIKRNVPLEATLTSGDVSASQELINK